MQGQEMFHKLRPRHFIIANTIRREVGIIDHRPEHQKEDAKPGARIDAGTPRRPCTWVVIRSRVPFALRLRLRLVLPLVLVSVLFPAGSSCCCRGRCSVVSSSSSSSSSTVTRIRSSSLLLRILVIRTRLGGTRCCRTERGIK